MEENKGYEGGSIADRLERLPFSKFHRNFLLMLTSGEWAESLMLLGNGAILSLVAAYFSLKGVYSTYALPVPFFLGEFVGSIFFGRLADARGRKAVFLYNQLLFGTGMLIAGFMPLWQLVALFVFIGGIGGWGEFPLVDSYGTEVFRGEAEGCQAGPYLYHSRDGSTTHRLHHLAHITSGYYSFRIPLWIMGVAGGFAVWAVRLRLTESRGGSRSTGATRRQTHNEADRGQSEEGTEPEGTPSPPVIKDKHCGEAFEVC